MAGTGNRRGNAGGDKPNDPAADTDYHDPEAEPQSLGEVAAAGLHAVTEEQGGIQEALDGVNPTKVKFVGMSFDSLEETIKIGDELVFVVRARCIGLGDEASKRDGSIRHTVKMDVASVKLQEEGK